MAFCTIYQAGRGSFPDINKGVSANACFSGTYTRLGDYTHINVYVLKNYKIGDLTHHLSTNHSALKEEEFLTYMKGLEKCGFKFKMSPHKINYMYGNDKYIVDGWVVQIELKENSPVMNLVLLNAIRYAYEGNFPEIARKFISLMPSRSKMKMINRFFMAHAGGAYNSGHSILPHNQLLLPILSDREIKELLGNKIPVTNTGGLRKLKMVPFAEIELVKQAFKDRAPLRVFEEYRKIDEKYTTIPKEKAKSISRTRVAQVL